MFWSSDAVQWESTKLQTKPYAEQLELLFVTGDRVCGIISTDGVPPQSIISTDGKSWTPRKALLDDWKVMVRDAHLRRIAHGNDCIVFTGDYDARLSGDTIDDKFQNPRVSYHLRIGRRSESVRKRLCNPSQVDAAARRKGRWEFSTLIACMHCVPTSSNSKRDSKNGTGAPDPFASLSRCRRRRFRVLA